VRFTWASTRPADPVTLVVYAADYTEIASRPGIVGTEWCADGNLLSLLRCGESYHCVVRSEAPAALAQSPLETFVIR
jgi:hypothetical protein